jgi:hypothetical protein
MGGVEAEEEGKEGGREQGRGGEKREGGVGGLREFEKRGVVKAGEGGM